MVVLSILGLGRLAVELALSPLTTADRGGCETKGLAEAWPPDKQAAAGQALPAGFGDTAIAPVDSDAPGMSQSMKSGTSMRPCISWEARKLLKEFEFDLTSYESMKSLRMLRPASVAQVPGDRTRRWKPVFEDKTFGGSIAPLPPKPEVIQSDRMSPRSKMGKTASAFAGCEYDRSQFACVPGVGEPWPAPRAATKPAVVAKVEEAKPGGEAGAAAPASEPDVPDALSDVASDSSAFSDVDEDEDKNAGKAKEKKKSGGDSDDDDEGFSDVSSVGQPPDPDKNWESYIERFDKKPASGGTTPRAEAPSSDR
jgi:hypothetical protein